MLVSAACNNLAACTPKQRSPSSAQKSSNLIRNRLSIACAPMLPITVSYYLEELLKGSALEGWADYLGLSAFIALLFMIRLFFFTSSKIDISGKVALITGGARGIGFMMAKKLAVDHSCKVISFDGKPLAPMQQLPHSRLHRSCCGISARPISPRRR